MHARKLGQSNSSSAGFGLDERPYTAPEEDPFNIQPLLLQPLRRRRSSMLDKWIQDQQQTVPVDVVDTDVTEEQERPATRGHPYLAYPELSPVSIPDASSSSASLVSYDLVDDTDIPHESQLPVTPETTKTSSRKFQTPPSLRAFHIPFRSASGPASNAMGTTSSSGSRTPSSSRTSFFSRTSRSSSAQHKKSSSMSTLGAFIGSNDEQAATPSKSRWRPSVLGHFGVSASQPSILTAETPHAPRPSISSNTTYTTQTDSDLPVTPPRSAAGDSVRTRGAASHRSYGNLLMKLADDGSSTSGHNASASPSFSGWSDPSYLDDLDAFAARAGASSFRGPTSTISCDGYLGMAPPPRTPLGSIRAASAMSNDGFVGMPARVPLAPKPRASRLANSAQSESIVSRLKDGSEVAYSPESKSRTLPRVSFASLSPRKKQKRLVISGIAPADARKFEAAKRWCESFGELTQILRMPNGDLHVYFRNAEVADTVCRVRAKVFIRGVGSVQLSWCTGTENIR
ncbi:hypothetical protein HMN09_00654200 [Mycena chlorophos]|uniref:Uncharacterized protein n=1 Tax=Mycena chlorophos TaxID=658473 RepID=A0A8H6T5A1_MYCCL|nr:hypothetical protein HMN09_00654200 [Mycena chlorophos]